MPSLQPPRRLRVPAATLASLLLLGVSAASAAQGPHSGAEPPGTLGLQRVVDLDPLTGTPRVVAQLDGFLTAPADGDARDIVLDYVRSRPALFKLDSDDLTRLRSSGTRPTRSGSGTCSGPQQAGGIPAFDNDLRASVTNDGRILNVMGSPLPDLAGRGNDVIYSRDGVRETVVKGGPGTDKARRDNADKTTSVERRF